MIKLNFNHLAKAIAKWFLVCGMVFSANALFAQSKSEYLLYDCKELAAKSKWTDAMECYQKALEHDSTNVEIQLGLARAFTGKGFNNNQFYTKAKELYDQILAKNPNNIESYTGLGDMYMDISLRDNKYNDAILNYKKAQAIDSNNAPIYTALGKAYDYNHQSELSVLNFEKAVSKNPRDTVALLQLGLIYNSLGRYQEAYTSFQRWYIQYPKRYSLLHSMAKMAYANGDYALCIEDYQKYLKTENADHEVIYDLAEAHFMLKQYKEAMKYYRICAKSGGYYCPRGMVRTGICLGMDAVVDTFVVKFLKSNYSGMEQNGYAQVCTWYMEKKNFQRTAVFARKMIKLNPKTEFGYYYLGLAQIGRKEFDKALLNINTSLKLQTSIFYKLGNMEAKAFVYIMQQKYDLAIKCYESIFSFASQEGLYVPEMHYKLGLIYAVQNKKELSEEHLGIAERTDRGHRKDYLNQDLWVVDFLKSKIDNK